MTETTWKYYNHALLPDGPADAHICMANFCPRELWKCSDMAKPFLARWTSDFDTKEETQWWWVVKDAPYVMTELSQSARKHIRQAMKKCSVRLMVPSDHLEEIWQVYNSAYDRYRNADNHLSRDAFLNMLQSEAILDYWGVFDQEMDQLIGWMSCRVFQDSVVIVTAKYDPQHMNKRASDAVHHTICEYYLNQQGKTYITAGERSINHVSNSQEYKIETFGFRKAYCRLHIVYRGWMKIAVTMLYPVRGLIHRWNHIGIVHSVDSILQMEEIHRSFS